MARWRAGGDGGAVNTGGGRGGRRGRNARRVLGKRWEFGACAKGEEHLIELSERKPRCGRASLAGLARRPGT